MLASRPAPTLALWLRAGLGVAGLFAYLASGLLWPVQRARPDFLQAEASLLVPPGLGGAFLLALGLYAGVTLLEVVLRRASRSEHGVGAVLRSSVQTSTPLGALCLFFLALVPGLPFVSDAASWLVVDARPWVATLAAGVAVYLKRPVLPPPSRIVFGLGILAIVIGLTPSRRFGQPYDARWGTGDEPRYVRITASLLHDADAEIGNAEEHIGRRVDVARFISGVLGWIPSTFATAREALVPGGSDPVEREPRYLGGPVIEGRDGGLYYAFLPGFPLLLAPAMALDSYLDPGHLHVTLFLCLLLGVLLVVLLAKLVEPFVTRRGEAMGLATALAFTLPLYFYHYQMYSEVTAAVIVTALLLVLGRPELTLRSVLLFALLAAYLPWLHGKYLPIWGVAMAAVAYKAWREKLDRRLFAAVILVPGIGLALNCLFVFHITGSLMPDALWVLHGYERSGMLVSSTTLAGLHYLFLGRTEGLFVYAPHLVLAVPGLLALRRRDVFAFVVGLGLAVPYVLAAASHDQGGAGAWSPPGRYLVPVLPVLAMALAAWLDSRLRWTAFLVLAAGSFWMGQGMLAELNYAYDRPAFLASLVVDPSPVLETAFLYPAMLALGLAGIAVAERFEMRPGRFAAALVFGLVLAGSLVSLRVSARPRRLQRLRAAPVGLELVCDPLRLRGVEEASVVLVESPGLDRRRRLIVPAGVPAAIDLTVRPVVRRSSSGREEHRVVTLRVAPGRAPVDVDTRCR